MMPSACSYLRNAGEHHGSRCQGARPVASASALRRADLERRGCCALYTGAPKPPPIAHPQQQINAGGDILASAGLPQPSTPNLALLSSAFDDKKLDAHFAIVPTGEYVDVNVLPPREREIYKLIVRRWLFQFLPNAESDMTTISVAAEGQQFVAKGSTLIAAGWRSLLNKTMIDKARFANGDEQGNGGDSAVLPAVDRGDAVRMGKVDASSSMLKASKGRSAGSRGSAMARTDTGGARQSRLQDDVIQHAKPRKGRCQTFIYWRDIDDATAFSLRHRQGGGRDKR